MNPIRPLVICGASGVGKGTLVKMLLKDFPSRFGFSVSHTTRKPREGEVEGIDYHFVTREQMLHEIEAKKFVEYAHVHTNIYGTSIAAVQNVLKTGKCCILDIDLQGARSVKEKSDLHPYIVFIKAPSFAELEVRLRGRHTETEESIQVRLKNGKEETQIAEQEVGKLFDALIVNDDLQRCYTELKQLIKTNVLPDLY